MIARRTFRFIGLFGLVMFTTGASASAMTVLKQVQVSDGSRVDLMFDGKLAPGQITTEYFNDIVQINLNDVSVYPPKISTVSGADLSKVFVYQYTPKLVRCRLTVKGKAENYQKRVVVKTNGKMLTVRIAQGGGDHVTVSSAHPVARAAAPVERAPDPEEQALLERVMKSQPLPPSAPSAPLARKDKDKDAGKPLAGGKALPSIWHVFGMLISVVGIFGVAVLLLAKLRKSKAGMTGAIGRWARKSLGSKVKMIDVVATHYLGPKKSIAVVKVAGRTLVLGIANDSINLITQVSGQAMADAIEDFEQDEKPAAAPSAGTGPDFFSDLLTSEAAKPSQGRPTQQHGAGPSLGTSFVRDSIRSQIRSKMEGMKPI